MIAPERQQVILAGVKDLLESKTWKPDVGDIAFALGYVMSYVRQTTGVECSVPEERNAVLDALLVVLR